MIGEMQCYALKIRPPELLDVWCGRSLVHFSAGLLDWFLEVVGWAVVAPYAYLMEKKTRWGQREDQPLFFFYQEIIQIAVAWNTDVFSS